jgi:hypothetical protein
VLIEIIQNISTRSRNLDIKLEYIIEMELQINRGKTNDSINSTEKCGGKKIGLPMWRKKQGTIKSVSTYHI